MNRREAKARVRNHLKTKGKHFCTPTETLVMWWWHVLNKAIFNEKLRPPVRFEFRNFHHETLGICSPFGRSENRDVVISLRREYDTRQTFLTVLAHEMVHQYQWVYERRMTHGKTFYDWEWRVKLATGLPLNEYVDED